MPKWLEEKLARLAVKKDFKGKRKKAYIYGGLRKSGWKPERER